MSASGEDRILAPPPRTGGMCQAERKCKYSTILDVIQQPSTTANPPVRTAWRLLIPPAVEGDGVSSPQAEQ